MELSEKRLTSKQVKNKRRNTIIIIISMVAFVLCFITTLQVRSVYANSQGSLQEFQRIEDLQLALAQEQNKATELSSQLETYKSELEALQAAPYDENETLRMLNNQLKNAQLLAGLTQVSGPGVIITLNDSTLATVTGVNANNYIVHDVDLLKVVNVLCNAGAEAISINGERVVATSEISCAGTVMFINDTKIGPPFIIKAIGDSDIMISSLKIKDGIYEQLISWIKFEIETKSEIVINPYIGTQQYQYAHTVGEDGGS